MKARCDFCGIVKNNVVVTHYGTTNYNRLICKDCINDINQHHREVLGDTEDIIDKNGKLRGE